MFLLLPGWIAHPAIVPDLPVYVNFTGREKQSLSGEIQEYLVVCSEQGVRQKCLPEMRNLSCL